MSFMGKSENILEQSLTKLHGRNIETLAFNKRYRYGEIAKGVLKFVVIAGAIGMLLAAPNMAQVLRLFGAKTARERYRAKRSLAHLKKKRFVHVFKRKGQTVVEVTDAGRKKSLQHDFEDIHIEHPMKWDGMWRIIAFDIPQKHWRARQAITRKLKKVGFYPLQKSVFVYPYDCREETDFIGEVFNIRGYIRYIEARKIEGEEDLRKYFSLTVPASH